ncbi:hypothetical protein [Nocardioides ferulae]|uniref:hypothetical protein n=1 Tax=Nocardioides ferulae TaxID=2340821 RepID=UPI000EB40123|nr:hypothetical protein [Nocardioides ferulae]
MRSRGIGWPSVLALTVTAFVAALGAGCSGGSEGDAGRAPISPAPAAAATSATRAGAAAEIEAVLLDRAAAVVAGDRRAFLRTVGGDRARQLAWFDRLRRLPVGEVTHELGTVTAGEDLDRFAAAVHLGVRLDGFDPEPVVGERRMSWRRVSGSDGSRWVVTRDRPVPGQVVVAPWDVPGTTVVAGDGVVLVVDEALRSREPRLLAEAEAARRFVDRGVPGGLEGAVVLAFRDLRLFASAGLDLAEVRAHGGMALPVLGPEGEAVAVRALLTPAGLRGTWWRRVVLRHELTHVALWEKEAPEWLVEGVAEYAAWQGERIQRVQRAAGVAARGGIDSMPPDGAFYADPMVNYPLARFACRVLAREHGRGAPYEALAAVADVGAVHHDEVDAVLGERFGTTADELATEAGRAIARWFGVPAGA